MRNETLDWVCPECGWSLHAYNLTVREKEEFAARHKPDAAPGWHEVSYAVTDDDNPPRYLWSSPEVEQGHVG